jgi:hypothetical protein
MLRGACVGSGVLLSASTFLAADQVQRGVAGAGRTDCSRVLVGRRASAPVRCVPVYRH